MKSIVVLIFSLIAFNSFAGALDEQVRSIEIEHNAKCSQSHRSMDVCFGKVQGLPGWCFWSVKFDCVSNAGDFQLKIKMKQSNGKEPVVRNFSIAE